MGNRLEKEKEGGVKQSEIDLALLDEYGTSKGCSCCASVCKKQKLKRRKGNGFEFVACHQVVRCSSNECAMCWQRDENSSNNHLKLLLCLVRGEDRPEYMRRGRN